MLTGGEFSPALGKSGSCGGAEAPRRPRAAVFVSGGGTNLQALLNKRGSVIKSGDIALVVSNKPDEAVQVLVGKLFGKEFDFVLGEKSGIRRKPAPDMTSECVKVLAVPRDKCVYIGDSEIDIQTARNSKMDEIAVTWGFRKVPFLKKHGATVIVDTAEELYQAICEE